MSGFQQTEQAHQLEFLKRPCFEGLTGFHERAFQFLPDHAHWNLAEPIRDIARDLFSHSNPDHEIQWHTYAGHGCSSQACCVNFLLPLADRPVLLSRWVDHVLGLEGAEVLPIESRSGKDWHIAFEWFPETDYLNEANKRGVRPRGSNSTSVDAALQFDYRGERRLLLIEWKYIEKYGSTRNAKEIAGDPTRDRRYSIIWKRPHGPIRADAPMTLQEFYLNPWYQLLRQQMLAYHAETDPFSGYDRATVLHISPDGNDALKRVNGVAFQGLAGSTLFEVFGNLLDPRLADRFRSVTTEAAFAPLADWPGTDWVPWLRDRYPNLFAMPAKDPA
jgi:hypothetical protein